MKTGILCRFALLCCVLLSGGCSLLKVSVSEGDPLPRAEVRMRVMTRGFYHDLTAAVARTAARSPSVSAAGSVAPATDSIRES